MSLRLSPALDAPPSAAAAASAAPAHTAPPGAAGVAGMLGSLAVVVGLILLLAWLARRLQSLRAARGGLLQVAGGVPVGAKERVVLLRVGDEQLLLGVAPGCVSLLHRYPQGVEPGTAGADHPAVVPFAARLADLLQQRKP